MAKSGLVRLAGIEPTTATGLSRVTLSKILNQKGYGTGTGTIDRLCQFFGCKVEDLMEHLPDVNEGDHHGNLQP